MFADSMMLKQLAAFILSTAITSLFVFLAGRWTKLAQLRYRKIFLVVAIMNLLLQPLFYFIPQLGALLPGLIIMTTLYIFGFGKFLIEEDRSARYKKGAELFLATVVIFIAAAAVFFVVALVAGLALSFFGAGFNVPKIGQ